MRAATLLGRRRGEARTGTPADLLTIGLGNPGAEFERTRHNAGAEAVELLARRHGAGLRAERGTHSAVASCRLDQKLLVLARPQTYMNESGLAARALVRRYGLADELRRLVVVHDELDLPLGVVRVKVGGGLAGHNGLESLRSHLHSTDFLRVRIGIGKPQGRTPGAEWVLKRPSKLEREQLDVSIVEAADAVELILADGPEAAMNVVNARR